jgi:hypothetical protein
MANRPNDKNLATLLRELGQEVDEDRTNGLTVEEKVLSDIARRILVLERDLTVTGSLASESARVERLRDFIEKETF